MTSLWKPPRQSVIEGVLAIHHDVTEQVRNNERAKESIYRLEQERELRESFVSTLSHVLRTPLTAASMCSQLVTRSTDQPLVTHKLASRIIASSDRAD